MKKVVWTLIIIVVCALLLTYIDYYIYKSGNRFPMLAIKTELKEKEMVVYKTLLYKLYYCTYNDEVIIADYFDKNVSCPRSFSIEDGYYINKENIKISEHDLYLMLYDNIYTLDMIDNMNSEEDVTKAIYVCEKYNSIKPNKTELTALYITNDSDNIATSKMCNVVNFPIFKLNENNEYDWIYDTNNSYCEIDANKKLYSKVTNGYCENDIVKMNLDDEWCKEAKNSTLSFKDSFDKICK